MTPITSTSRHPLATPPRAWAIPDPAPGRMGATGFSFAGASRQSERALLVRMFLLLPLAAALRGDRLVAPVFFVQRGLYPRVHP